MSRRTEDAPENGLKGPGPEERPHPSGRRNDQGIRIDPEAEAEPTTRQAVLSALVTHEPGVLAGVSGLFARRQFNIDSLTVGATFDEEYARMTIVIEEPEPGVEQAKKQLEKLVPVVSVTELEDDAIRRELALIKISGADPEGVNAVAEMYGAKTVDATPGAITVEVTGSGQKIDAALEAFSQFEVQEVKRTGTAALGRGTAPTAATPPSRRGDAGTESEADAVADGGDGGASGTEPEGTTEAETETTTR
jgi:acetolactate synthase-1/3 small subunit